MVRSSEIFREWRKLNVKKDEEFHRCCCCCVKFAEGDAAVPSEQKRRWKKSVINVLNVSEPFPNIEVRKDRLQQLKDLLWTEFEATFSAKPLSKRSNTNERIIIWLVVFQFQALPELRRKSSAFVYNYRIFPPRFRSSSSVNIRDIEKVV